MLIKEGFMWTIKLDGYSFEGSTEDILFLLNKKVLNNSHNFGRSNDGKMFPLGKFKKNIKNQYYNEENISENLKIYRNSQINHSDFSFIADQIVNILSKSKISFYVKKLKDHLEYVGIRVSNDRLASYLNALEGKKIIKIDDKLKWSYNDQIDDSVIVNNIVDILSTSRVPLKSRELLSELNLRGILINRTQLKKIINLALLSDNLAIDSEARLYTSRKD